MCNVLEAICKLQTLGELIPVNRESGIQRIASNVDDSGARKELEDQADRVEVPWILVGHDRSPMFGRNAVPEEPPPLMPRIGVDVRGHALLRAGDIVLADPADCHPLAAGKNTGVRSDDAFDERRAGAWHADDEYGPALGFASRLFRHRIEQQHEFVDASLARRRIVENPLGSAGFARKLIRAVIGRKGLGVHGLRFAAVGKRECGGRPVGQPQFLAFDQRCESRQLLIQQAATSRLHE